MNYNGNEESNSYTSSAAIIAAFFVSFTIVVLFSFGILWPRFQAYMSGSPSHDGKGNSIPLHDQESVEDGSVDRSTTPFTHTSDAAVANSVANSNSPFRGGISKSKNSDQSKRGGEGGEETPLASSTTSSSASHLRSPPKAVSVTSSDGVDMGKFHAVI